MCTVPGGLTAGQPDCDGRLSELPEQIATTVGDTAVLFVPKHKCSLFQTYHDLPDLIKRDAVCGRNVIDAE